MGNVKYATGIDRVSGSLSKPKVKEGHQIAARNRFASIAALVKARKANIQYITTDQENFIAQKDVPGGCKTMKKYYWSICGAEWDAQH